MNGLQLLHSADWGMDSTVFRLGQSVVKVYKPHIQIGDLEQYHTLHNLFGKEEISFKFPGKKEVEYWNGKKRQRGNVSEIITTVLQFPEDSIRTSSGVTVSVVPYVEGGTALEFIGKMHNGTSFWYGSVEKILEGKLGTNQLFPRNIKIGDLEDGVIRCTITDLACSIKDLISSN